MQLLVKFTIVALALAASGCGLKGPLRLPDDTGAASGPATGSTTNPQARKNRATGTASDRETPAASDPSGPATPPQGR